MHKLLKPGKLPHSFLKNLIAKLPSHDQDVIIPPGIGLDASGLKINDKLFALTTDPITLSTTKLSTYSVAVNINDVACLGCKPRWYLSCLLLPIGTSETEIIAIWKNLTRELKRYKIQSIGGHVEVTSAVSSPVIIGQMIGEALGDNLLTPQNSKPGHQILLWRSIAIEGTALLATEYFGILKNHLPITKLKKMQKLLHNPGICIWPLVKKLIPCDGLVAIHDITEGGITTALHELADASNLGLTIDGDAIPIRPETKTLAKILKFNPLGLLASGSALIICNKHSVANIMRKVGPKDLTLIGEFTKNKNRLFKINKKYSKLPRFDSDEIVKIL